MSWDDLEAGDDRARRLAREAVQFQEFEAAAGRPVTIDQAVSAVRRRREDVDLDDPRQLVRAAYAFQEAADEAGAGDISIEAAVKAVRILDRTRIPDPGRSLRAAIALEDDPRAPLPVHTAIEAIRDVARGEMPDLEELPARLEAAMERRREAAAAGRTVAIEDTILELADEDE